MEDELQKRNTDCVYFLASPRTCKKGIECEFRHSEIARLNPRDCWYWLAGSCLNPTCAFRHPPIEGRSEKSADPSSLAQQAPTPVIKNNVPCYFYFNGFCNKGDNCPFLHAPNSVSFSQFSKLPSSVTTDLESSKTFASNEGVIVSAAEPPCFNELEITTVQSVPPSPQNLLLPECVKSEIIFLPENLQSESPIRADESSEDRFEGQPEERWESSPGFDVLVDDGSEQLGVLHDGEDGVLPEHFGYDPMVYERGVYPLEDGHISDHVRRVPNRSRETMNGNYPVAHHKKRQRMSRDIDFNGTDLRNHLQKRRRITSRSRNEIVRHSHVQGRLASEVRIDRIVSRSESESDSHHRRQGWSQSRYSSRSKQKDREKRRQARPNPVFSDSDHPSFTGPKTLAQIKEEKRKAREEKFEGPEILKEKTTRRVDLVDDLDDDNDLGFDNVDNDDDCNLEKKL